MGARGLKCRRHFFMENINKYINNFTRRHKENSRFAMKASDILSAVRLVKGGNPADVICNIFRYGYAKGYSACESEMKKGGAA